MTSELIASDHIPRLLEQNKDEETQESYIVGKPLNSSLNARAFFNSASPLVRKGDKSPIVDADIWRLDEENTAGYIWSEIEPEWEAERARPDASLFRVFRKVLGKTFLGAFGVFAVYGILTFVNPVMLPFLITYVNDPNVPNYAGYIYVLCSILGQLVASFCYYNGLFRGNLFGIRIRSAMISLVYRKSLTMAPKRDSNTGQVVNLISSDALFIADTMNLFLPGMTAPIQIIIAIVILAVYVSYYVVITVGMLMIALPIAAVLGRRFGTYRLNIQKSGDRRLKLTNELLQGIRIVKYYAWENAFRDNIEANRDEELKSVLGLSISRALLIFIMRYSTVIAVAITLITYAIYTPGGLTQSIAFLVFSILNIVQTAFILLPVSMSFIGQYLNSFGRVQTFISQPDIVPTEPTNDGEVRVVIEKGEFTWPGAQQPAVKNVNLNAKRGDLAMVVGSVGSGKSSLISALLGELPRTEGSLKLNGSLAYAAQEAFIFNSTVRENIIFGKPFEMQKYRAVLEASALVSDLAQFTAGDQTEIGERGVNLSGGQKQRIAIARALYADADIILLDDPLSAVDAHVSKHLFEKAIQGMLNDKLVVLATNQLQYLPFATEIIFLQGNEMVAKGKFADLIKSNAAFADQMSKYGVMSGEKKEVEAKKEEVKPVQQQAQQKASENSGLLIKDEEKQSGLIGPEVYSYYIKKGGVASFVVMLLFFAGTTGARITGSWWISQWTSMTQPGEVPLTYNQYIGIYGGLIGAEVLFALGAIMISVVLTIRASKSLHFGLLSKIVRAPTSFFDTTPLGRILNRFSKELDLIDSILPLQFFNFFNAIFILGSIFASMAFASPYMLIPVAALIVGYFFFNMYFTKTYLEIQRQEALSRAPMFSRLGETLRGAATIRAFKMENVFRNLNNFIIDTNSRHRFAQVYVLSWYGLRLDALGSLLILVLLVLIVTLRIASPDTISGPFASLALSYTSSLTSVLSLLNSNKTDTEARLNSVERIKEYDLLPQEAPEIIEENRPPKNWPERGDITFKNVSLKYSPQGEKVLNNVTVDIAGEEKVGIVGRTGAGKSTMLQALFRLVELDSGSIEIDGIDISMIGLRDLRSKISIIPQEPVLFLGTVRYNLDPFNEHSDVELWEALKMVNLSTVIEGLTGQLDATVEENGSNFSVGQRQLICMARALLRKTKILVMDEATASVDLDTDMLIQTMVRRNFANRTSLTIAHRLNTVMDSTKVMVLNRGQLVEYDKPINLLNDDKTIFHSMVQATGPEQAVHLKRIANGEIGVVQSLQSLKEISSASESSV